MDNGDSRFPYPRFLRVRWIAKGQDNYINSAWLNSVLGETTMGLMALVYKNKASLESQFEGAAFDVDGHTGEAVLLDGLDVFIEPKSYVAESAKFGNVAQIAYLSQKIAKILASKDTFIQRAVLYSGSHSGDIIEVNDVSKLERDVHMLYGTNCTDVRNFVNSLRVLIDAARQEGNPIVFV